jgi:hypothetical protein
MSQNELNIAALNHEITTLLAACPGGKRMWMRVNPALGTMTFTVTGPSGRPACETLSLAKAIDAYNDLDKEAAA